MKLSSLKKHLSELNHVSFIQNNGESVPVHFHVTEVGKVSKSFMDCGGVLRQEESITLQLWVANDYDHRLAPEKFLSILELSEQKLNLEDLPVEVEYQGETIGRYDLGFKQGNFLLKSKKTACLALDACGIPVSKTLTAMAELGDKTNCCGPNSTCC